MRNLYQELQNKFNKNLDLMKKCVPNLAPRLSSPGDINCELVVYNNGQINLSLKGQLLYPENAKNYVSNYVEQFLKKPQKFFTPIPEEGEEPQRKTINHIYLHKLYKLYSGYASQEIIDRLYHLENYYFPVLIVFGIGLGYHIPLLIRKTIPHVLIIVEEDINLLKSSFYTLDWEEILKILKKKKTNLFFVLNQSLEKIVDNIINIIKFVHPILAYNLFLFLAFNNRPSLQELRRLLKEKIFLVLRGWGFFDDEMRSLVQTAININNRIPVYIGKTKVPSDATAIVVGAGPSLDRKIDFIKKNRRNSVIISCGTAIKALASEDIIPDFHVEIERPKITFDILKSSLSADFLRQFSIIGANPLYPKVFQLGKRSGMFLKLNDAGAELFDKRFPRLGKVNPTVTNSGLSLALHHGFKKVILIGVDLGWIEPHRHHSSKSAYFDKKSIIYKPNFKYDRIVPNRKGKFVYTTDTLLWTKNAMEIIIKEFNDAIVYNLSEGLDINGTREIDEDVKILSSINKTEIVELMYRNYVSDYEINLENKMKQIISDLHTLKKSLTKNLNRDIKNQYELTETFININNTIQRFRIKNPCLYILINGSLWHIQGRIFSYYLSFKETKIRRKFLANSITIFSEFLNKIEKNLSELKTNIEKEKINNILPNEENFYIFSY